MEVAMRRAALLIISILSLLVGSFAAGASSASALSFGVAPSRNVAQMTTAEEAHPCVKYTNHTYEVCVAYVFNCSWAVLLPYYKYAHSTNPAIVSYVTYRLGSRYSDNAYNLLTRRSATWPAGTNNVSPPSIKIISARSSLTTNTATLVTEESWRVRDAAGRVIYQENNLRHTVTLYRVQSYILHEWDVVDIR